MKNVAAGIMVWSFAAVSLFAVEQTVSKVTYFPLAYTGYHALAVDTLEVGVGRKQSGANRLGKAALSKKPLVVSGNTIVDGTLSLKKASLFTGPRPSGAGEWWFGAPTTLVPSKVKFSQSVRLGTLAKFKNLNVKTVAVGQLQLGEGSRHLFPTCDNAFDAYGNTMRWARLRIRGTDTCKWYLACGPISNEGSPTPEEYCLMAEETRKKCKDWLRFGRYCEYGANTANENKMVSAVEFNTYCCNSPQPRYELIERDTEGSDTTCAAQGGYTLCDVNDGTFNYDVGSGAPTYFNNASFFTPTCEYIKAGTKCDLQTRGGGQYYCHRYECHLGSSL